MILVFCLDLMWLKFQWTVYVRISVLLKDDGTPVGFSNQISVIVTELLLMKLQDHWISLTENWAPFDLTCGYKHHPLFLLQPKIKIQYNHRYFLVNTYGNNRNMCVYVSPFAWLYKFSFYLKQSFVFYKLDLDLTHSLIVL